jgi:hypothetical protein
MRAPKMRSDVGSRSSMAGGRALGYAFAVTLGVLVPREAVAVPGQATRLGGIGPQGPATPSVSAIHHNPAMLGALRGTAFTVSIAGVLEQERVRRNTIDPSSGQPTGQLGGATSLVHPGVGYFVGASFYFDPVAIGVGIYDVGSQSRLTGADSLRYHNAPDPDRGCLRLGLKHCPPNGGQVSYRHDVSLALAYDGGAFQLGAGLHLPMIRERFAFDNDTALGSRGTENAACPDKEDPGCAERIGFKGWTQWIPRGGAPAGFDAAVTVGFGLQLVNETVRLGARYRTFPLRRGGEVALGGVAQVCRPTPGASNADAGVPACAGAGTTSASLRERVPQELALGGSFVLGRSRVWRLDLNLYWLDLCQGGVHRAKCRDGGDQLLRLVGLDRRAFVLPEFSRYRGLQDIYGIDAYASWKAHARATMLFAGHANTAPVRRSAAAAGSAGGARIGITAGAQLRVTTRGRSRATLVLTPGYGFDVSLPRTVSPGRAAFSPAAAGQFADSGGDINAPGADLVLAGRARPTNAGRYLGFVHTLSLALSWGDAFTE